MAKKIIPIDFYLERLNALEKYHAEQMQKLWAHLDKCKKWDEEITVMFQELDKLLKKQNTHFEEDKKDDDDDNVCA